MDDIEKLIPFIDEHWISILTKDFELKKKYLKHKYKSIQLVYLIVEEFK